MIKENDLSIYVVAKEVAAPKKVQYGYRAFMPGNIRSTYGLPVVPFRADIGN